MDIVRTGWGENESIYVLDARQVYFLKKVGEQLDSGTLQALKEEKEAIKYLTNFEDRQNYLEEEYQYQGITPPKLDDFEAYSYKDQLSYLRKGHFAMNNEIRREIKRMVKKQEPLPSFDLDYGGLDTVRIVVTAYSPNVSRRSVRCLSQRGRFGGREPGSPSINQNHTTTIMKISD